jgi:hypothetical protein
VQGDEAYAAFARRNFATIPERKEAVLWFYSALEDAFIGRIQVLRKEGFREFDKGIESLIRDFAEVLEIVRDK